MCGEIGLWVNNGIVLVQYRKNVLAIQILKRNMRGSFGYAGNINYLASIPMVTCYQQYNDHDDFKNRNLFKFHLIVSLMYNGNCSVMDPASGRIRGTGWLPPMPDMRDYTDEHAEVQPLVNKMKNRLQRAMDQQDGTAVDLRPWCSPVEDQGGLGSCTAHAAMGIVEYFQKKAFGKHLNGSRLFLYKTTRNLAGVKGDTGAWLRNAMGAMVLCGIPEEKYWPYVEADFDKEPSSFVYAVADNFETIRYFCHDPMGRNIAAPKVLGSIRKYLREGISSRFGFYGFPSFEQSEKTGRIPYPGPDEKAQWGHAVAAFGYDDQMKITNSNGKITTKGALLIRNSWGTGWGEKGYGWLPYEYVLNTLASDFWSLLSMQWIDTESFV
jgi:C1A family cysteine protease